MSVIFKDEGECRLTEFWRELHRYRFLWRLEAEHAYCSAQPARRKERNCIADHKLEKHRIFAGQYNSTVAEDDTDRRLL